MPPAAGPRGFLATDYRDLYGLAYGELFFLATDYTEDTDFFRLRRVVFLATDYTDGHGFFRLRRVVFFSHGFTRIYTDSPAAGAGLS